MSKESDIALIQSAFDRIPCLYIADGHHRSAAAARVYRSRKGRGQSGWFLAVIFPHDQVQILPYNRVLKDLNGLSPETLLRKLEAVFTIRSGGPAQPRAKHQVCLFLQGKWATFSFRPELTAAAEPVERLDVALLQKHVLGPMFGIDDPRTSRRIDFVGGLRGTAELESRVKSGECACAFSMFPCGMDDLMAIADAGQIMPPKSTWFEPKLRDGICCHLI